MSLEPQKFSKDGYEEHLQVNHLAPALLSILLLPSLIRGSPSRIINVNSVVSFMGTIQMHRTHVFLHHIMSICASIGNGSLFQAISVCIMCLAINFILLILSYPFVSASFFILWIRSNQHLLILCNENCSLSIAQSSAYIVYVW